MKKIIILIPLFNDWKSVSKLLNEIDQKINNWEAEVSIIIVNDASTEERSELKSNYQKIKIVKILNMKKNTVHQRCIAAGLKYIYKNEDFDRVIIIVVLLLLLRARGRRSFLQWSVAADEVGLAGCLYRGFLLRSVSLWLLRSCCAICATRKCCSGVRSR